MLLLSGSSTLTQQPTVASPLIPQEQQSLQSTSASELPYVDYTDSDWNKVLHSPLTNVPLCTSEPLDHLPIPPSESVVSTCPNMVSYSSDTF
eukprot:3529504-Ditylum_brightwellii.AAC.1